MIVMMCIISEKPDISIIVVMCFPENDRLKAEEVAGSGEQQELEQRITRLVNERLRLERELEVLEAEHQARLAALAYHQAMVDAFREKLRELSENQEKDDDGEEEMEEEDLS